MFDLLAEAQVIYQEMLAKNPLASRQQSARPKPINITVSSNLQNPQRVEAAKDKGQPVLVTCSSCSNFERDRIGSGQGIGRCNIGQEEKQAKSLWADGTRLCHAWVAYP